jgi:hypothetical protein
VAGIARRKRKSPTGFVRWKTTVRASGVWMPAIGLAGSVGVEAGDRRVVERILAAVLGLREALEGVEDVLRRHGPIDRRAELHALLEVEGVRPAAVGRRRDRRRDVGDDLVPRRTGHVVVADESPDHQVREDVEREPVVLTRRVEAVREAERVLEREAVRAPLLRRRARSAGRRAARARDDERQPGEHAEGSS